ncbi:hypothetical protein B0H13DRAFT_1892033 [Mycena leptocephala]|nr:hypothetical protein B0H13DRAFT_1892033 [Mycena leptocephala]
MDFDNDIDIENDLYEAMAPLVDTPESWDTFDDSSNLLSVRKFTKFVLVPHIATTLISRMPVRACHEHPRRQPALTPKNEEPFEPPHYHKKPAVQTKAPKAKDKPKSKKDPKQPKPSRKQEELQKHRTRSTKLDECLMRVKKYSQYMGDPTKNS